MDQARPSPLLLLPRDPKDSPVSALSQIPGLRRLELVAEVKAGVEAVGVDRHALLTPPAPEGKEGSWSQGCPGPAQPPGALRRPSQPEPTDYGAASFAPLSKLVRKLPTWAAAVNSDIPAVFGCPLYCLSLAVSAAGHLPQPGSLSLLFLLLLPWSLVGCLQDRQVCRLSHLCAPYAPAMLLLLHPSPHSSQFLDQSRLLREGLPEHSSHGDLSSL